MFNGIKGYPDDLAVSASEDGKTFTVEMAAPCAYMLDLCAFPTFFPVKQSEVEGAEGYLDEDGNILNPNAWATEAGFISSGAYVLTEWNHNESMVYEKNPNYWNADNVKIERIEFMLSADVPLLAVKDVVADPVNPFSGRRIDEVSKPKQEQLLLYSFEWDVNVNCGTQFIAGDWYTVNGDIWNKNAWHSVANKAVLTAER